MQLARNNTLRRYDATTLRRMSARAKLHGTSSPLSESKLRTPTTPTTPTTPISKLRQISQISSPERITCKVGHPVGHLNRFQSLDGAKTCRSQLLNRLCAPTINASAAEEVSSQKRLCEWTTPAMTCNAYQMVSPVACRVIPERWVNTKHAVCYQSWSCQQIPPQTSPEASNQRELLELLVDLLSFVLV